MTRIDFYILPADSDRARLEFTCRLIDKVYHLGRNAYIATEDARTTEQLDELLWSLKPESFIPHQIDPPMVDSQPPHNTLEPPAPLDTPVLIGHNTQGGVHHDLLINLSNTIPSYFSRFERLSEIVIQRESLLQVAREHFAFYRNRGYPVKSHDMRQTLTQGG